MAQRGPNGWMVAAIVLVVVGTVVANYQIENPTCKNCGRALALIKLYESIACPVCGQVLTGVETALA